MLTVAGRLQRSLSQRDRNRALKTGTPARHCSRLSAPALEPFLLRVQRNLQMRQCFQPRQAWPIASKLGCRHGQHRSKEHSFIHAQKVPVKPSLVHARARSRAASGLARHVPDPVSERTACRLPCRRRCGRARVDREPRLHRAAYVAFPDRRRRTSGLPPDRPRPERRQPVVARPRHRHGRKRSHG